MRPVDRGQTVIDFAVGAGIFLIATGIVFAFIPTMFEPFTSAAGSSPIVADRTADHLTGSMLAADPSTPSVLSAVCTAAFFDRNGSLSHAANCGFDAAEPTGELLGVGDRDVNVTVRHLSDSPTTGPPVSGSRLASVDEFTDRLSVGTSRTVPTDVTVSSRVVLIEGEQYRFVVKVW